jgi:hypothetical protein
VTLGRTFYSLFVKQEEVTAQLLPHIVPNGIVRGSLYEKYNIIIILQINYVIIIFINNNALTEHTMGYRIT